MKRVLVTVAAVAATAVVGTAVPLGLSLTAAGSEQPPAVTRTDKGDAHGPPAWAQQKPGEQREAAKARWKQERRAHLDAWKAWKKEQQKAWRAQDSHDGPPPWAGGPWRTGPGR
jgi:hypothetical protein